MSIIQRIEPLISAYCRDILLTEISANDGGGSQRFTIDKIEGYLRVSKMYQHLDGA